MESPQSPNSNNLPQPNPQKDDLESLDTLTDRDWKFIAYKMKGYGTAESYRLAGFTGKSHAAAYSLYNHLKKKMLMIQEVAGMDRFHLLVEAKKVLDLPLKADKTDVTLGEKMKAIRLASTLIPEAREPQSLNITNFTINRYDKKEEVVDVKPVDATDPS